MSDDFVRDPEFKEAIPKPVVARRFKILNVLIGFAIVAVVIALLLPATRTARPAARRMQCANNLKNIGIALHAYEHAYGVLPPAYTVDANGRPLHSWRTLILPYLDEESLYRTIDLSKSWNDPANAKAFNATINGFRCPESVGPPNTTTYLANVAPNGCFLPGKPRRLAEITDDHGSTLMVFEAGDESAVPWMAPVDADESLVMNFGPSSKLHHASGAYWLSVDGSVMFIKASTRAEVRRKVISISGNEQVSHESF